MPASESNFSLSALHIATLRSSAFEGLGHDGRHTIRLAVPNDSSPPSYAPLGSKGCALHRTGSAQCKIQKGEWTRFLLTLPKLDKY